VDHNPPPESTGDHSVKPGGKGGLALKKSTVLTSLIILVLTPLLALVVTDLYDRLKKIIVEPVPFDVVVKQDDSCPNGSWIFPVGFETRMLPGFDQLNSRWAYRHGGYSVERSVIELSLQGKGDKVVVLHGLQVEVAERRSPPAGVIVTKCHIRLHEAVNTRRFEIDLDEREPVAVPRQTQNLRTEPDETPQFPYVISSSEPEIFEIFAYAKDCLCSWTAELDWTSGEKSGTVNVLSGTGLFKTSGRGTAAVLYYYPDGSLKTVPDPSIR
jgi:hypothetical protein